MAGTRWRTATGRCGWWTSRPPARGSARATALGSREPQPTEPLPLLCRCLHRTRQCSLSRAIGSADGSLVAFSWNQHADDNFKIDSSNATMRHITLIDGNIGSTIELGTYGLGLRNNAVRHTVRAPVARMEISWLCS